MLDGWRSRRIPQPRTHATLGHACVGRLRRLTACALDDLRRYGAQVLAVSDLHGMAAYAGHNSAVLVCVRSRAVLRTLCIGFSK